MEKQNSASDKDVPSVTLYADGRVEYTPGWSHAMAMNILRTEYIYQEELFRRSIRQGWKDGEGKALAE